MRVKSESWRKRHAILIVSQLPENHDDAVAVLAYARELVDGFLADDPLHQDHPILAFSSASKSR